MTGVFRCSGLFEDSHESYARHDIAFRMLGRIRPRSKDESLTVLCWMLEDKQNMDSQDTDAIRLNLIG